jgi:hypothetical protein
VVVLVPEGIGERLDRGRARQGEAVQGEQQVQVAQGQLAMLVQQRQAHPAEVPSEQLPRIGRHGR